MSKETGGPAFPREDYQCNGAAGSLGQEGMTLRDYFAAKVMQGTQSNHEWNHWSSEQHVEYAYGVADAMLKARTQ
ncbi:TPA: hypothetical protein SLG40_001612 [Serratia odorifera]|nr:hypothetical protein [Serratia odorifera]